MNAIIFFALMTIINVTLSTIRSLCTIKGGKWLSAITNAVCYGFYPLIVMLTAKDTVTIWVNMTITAVANFVCVWLIKFVEEKARKDKLWKVEIAVAKCYQQDVERNLCNIPHNYIDTGSWIMFNCYCNCQSETAFVVDVAKRYKGKISAYESKSLIQTSLVGWQVKAYPLFFYFLLSGSLALVSEPNLRFCAVCTISSGNVCATFHLDFSLNMWYYILVKRGTDTQSKRIEKTETKKIF